MGMILKMLAVKTNKWGFKLSHRYRLLIGQEVPRQYQNSSPLTDIISSLGWKNIKNSNDFND